MVANRGKQSREVEQIPKKSPQFGLQAATRLHEVGIASNRGSACRGEYVPNFHGLTGGVYKARERIHRGMLIRDY